jgi:hypothetical protein
MCLHEFHLSASRAVLTQINGNLKPPGLHKMTLLT